MIQVHEVHRGHEGEEFKSKAITVYCPKRVGKNFIKMEESKTTGTNPHEEQLSIGIKESQVITKQKSVR